MSFLFRLKVVVRVRRAEVQQACSSLAGTRRKRQASIFFDRDILLTLLEENKEQIQNVSLYAFCLCAMANLLKRY